MREQALPKWDPKNLSDHHKKHPADKDKKCWQDLLGVTDRVVSEAEYEHESLSVCSNRWLEYEAEKIEIEWLAHTRRRGEPDPYHSRRRYNVDDRLLTTIVEPADDAVVTCFHEHFDRPHDTGGHMRPVGELRARYNKHLENLELSKMMRRIERIHEES